MKRAFLLAAVLLALGASEAQARYLPFSTAYRAVYWNNQRAKREADWDERLEVGRCRYSYSRYECPVELEGRQPVDYDVEVGLIYRVDYCGWVAAAHWRGRRLVVTRRRLFCEHYYESSRGATW